MGDSPIVLLTLDSTTFWNLGVALLGGLAVGVERQWSGHAAGPRGRFAGIRTFSMLGLVAGLSGWLYQVGIEGLSVILLGGMGALVVAAYFAASRHDVEGTTEVAAFVVLTAGVLAGFGATRAAAGIIAITVLLLVEKTRLHSWVHALDRQDVRAAARFAVMAMVILPLLPAGRFGPMGTFQPRLLWALVLFFSGLSFVGFIARRVIGEARGYAIAGAVGGLISSTSVTLTYSRLSRTKDAPLTALAAGVLGANLILFPRVLFATAVLAPALPRAAWPLFVAPALIAAVLAASGLRRGPTSKRPTLNDNPLQFVAALQMAVIFQFVLLCVAYARAWFGQAGIYSSAAVLGLADMDALAVSLAQLTTGGTDASVTARALAIGVLSNTMVKLGIALVIGRARFRTLVATGLALMGAALLVGLYFFSI